MIKAKIFNKKLMLEGDIASDSIKFDRIKFTFPEDWSGYDKTVTFSNDLTKISVVFAEGNPLYLGNDECYIPHEINKSPGFYVSVFGTKDDSVATSSKEFIKVIPSGYELGDAPNQPSPDIYQQIIILSNQTKEIAQSVRTDADNGMFKGEKGDMGDSGVHYGTEEPTDPSHPLWINPEGEGFDGNLATSEYVDAKFEAFLENAQSYISNEIQKFYNDNYIVEQGTNGIWTYRKWNNGTAECWGKLTGTIACNNAWGNIYTSGASNIDICAEFPTGLFITTPVCIMSFERSTNANYWVSTNDNQCTNTHTAAYQVLRATPADAVNYTFTFNVKGSWK